MRKTILVLSTLFVCLNLSAEKASIRKADPKKGKILYDQMCFVCHQPDGKGKAGLGPRLDTPDLLFLANDDFFEGAS